MVGVDVAILVPKIDERRAVEFAFGLELGKADRRLSSNHAVWHFPHGGRSVALVVLQDQTNSVAAIATATLLNELDPVVVLLLGTAMGRQGEVALFDVVYADRVLDLQESSLEESGAKPRPRLYETPSEIKQDLEAYADHYEWKPPNRTMQTRLGSAALATPRQRKAPIGATVASVNTLVRTAARQKAIWALDGRLRALDMESAGFASAALASPRRRQWAVVRGISDFGTRESKAESHRLSAAYTAASFVHGFIRDGLVEADPVRLRQPETALERLDERNFYYQSTFPAFAHTFVSERLGSSIDKGILDSGLTTADLVTALQALGCNYADAESLACELREAYFSKKYGQYDDAADLRSLLSDWHLDFAEVLAHNHLSLSEADVIYVGVGTGRDLDAVVPHAKSLTATDVSGHMLDLARERRRPLTAMQCAAEDLTGIADNSFDLYLSLRTFQSSLFSIPRAIREAHRVLRRGGLAVISIPDAYVDRDNDAVTIVRGLLVGDRIDQHRPFELALETQDALVKSGFEAIGALRKRADFYIWGRLH